jgi:hypothetical protein
MNRQEGERLIHALSQTIREMMVDQVAAKRSSTSNGPAPTAAPAKPLEEVDIEPDKAGRVHLSAELLEKVFQQFKNRMIDELRIDPIFLELLAARPEIELVIQPRRVSLDASTTRGRVARLVAAGWFASTRATGGVRKELARTGPDPGGGGTLSDILAAFVKDGLLVRDGDGYQAAPGIKVMEKYLEAK